MIYILKNLANKSLIKFMSNRIFIKDQLKPLTKIKDNRNRIHRVLQITHMKYMNNQTFIRDRSKPAQII